MALLRIEEVASQVGVSVYTINNWYKFKKENPDHPLAKILPDYQQATPTSPRMWQKRSIRRIIKFKETRPLGPNGQMGSVTQRYYNKERKEK